MELKDPDSLKCNILQLLINYPTGLKFMDFSRMFYNTHHFHPQLSSYGYHSLRELLDDMKETIVVECSTLNGLVMKLSDDLNFDALMEEIEKIRFNSFGEEGPSLKKRRRKMEEDVAAAELAEILAAMTKLLLEYVSGLKLEKIQAVLLSTSGIDLESFSISRGYKDVVAFLDDHIPHLIIKYRWNLRRCVVQFPKDLTIVSVPVCSILASYPDGLKLAKLKKAVKKKCGYDLELFCYQVGFPTVVFCLWEIPELVITKNKNRNFTIRLKPAFFRCSSSQSGDSSSFTSEQPTCTSKNGNQAALEKKPDQPASSKVENAAVVSCLSLVHPVPVTKPAVKTIDSHSILTSDSPEKPESKDCSISKDLSLNMLPSPCQEQKQARTGMAGSSCRVDRSDDIPVLPGCSLSQAEFLIIPPSFLTPVPTGAMMPIPEPYCSFLQNNKPFTEFHAQSIPGSIEVTEVNTSHLNGPGPKLGEITFIPHCSAALPMYFQSAKCGETLQPGMPQSRLASPTKPNISDIVPSVDSTPVSPVSVKPSEIHSRRSVPQSSDSIQPRYPVPPPSPILSTGQRNDNCASAESDSFSEAQKQSGALQHFPSPDSPAKRSSVSSLPRNTASSFPSRFELNHQLQLPAHARLGDLESTSVSLADRNLGKASLNRVSPAATCPRRPTYVNPLEASATTESFTACSVSGSLHASSVTTNSGASSSVSSGTRAVSPAASPLDSTANSYDQTAYASARTTSNSSPLHSETRASTQQRQYDRAAATGFSNTRAPRPTSWSPESIAPSHHQFAYASSRSAANSSNLSSETYDFMPQRQSTQASETTTPSNTITASSISSPGSTTSLPHQHASASARATSTPNVLSGPTTCPIPNADVSSYFSFDSPTQNNLTCSLLYQEDQPAACQENVVPDTSLVPRLYEGCIIL